MFHSLIVLWTNISYDESTLKFLQDKYDYLFKFIIIGSLARNISAEMLGEQSKSLKKKWSKSASWTFVKTASIKSCFICFYFSMEGFQILLSHTKSNWHVFPCFFEWKAPCWFSQLSEVLVEQGLPPNKKSPSKKEGFNIWDTEIPHIHPT